MNQQDNENNLKSISLEDVKGFIKSSDPVYYDKMIISSNEIVKRTDFLYINYSAEFVNRNSLRIVFPMYGSIKDNFEEFSGGDSVHGNKKEIKSQHIFNTLSNSYNINFEKDINSSSDDFEWPISEKDGVVNSIQPPYFIPSRTNSWNCENCNGKKYVTCDDHDCHGRHEWDCGECNAKGILTCNKCSGVGRLDCSTCNGSNKVKCNNCGGDGRVGDGIGSKLARGAQDGRQKDKFFQEKSCGSCSGKGRVNCSKCNNGKVTCSKCSGGGKVTCSNCSGHKSIVCKKCYSDKERYGKIDCKECKAMGEMGKISFVETKVNEKSISKIFYKENNINDTDPQSLLKFGNSSKAQITILKNYNNTSEKNYAEIFTPYMDEIHKELTFRFSGYQNRVTKEELYCQVIPCVQIEFRHMLTNKLHYATINNFFNNPEIIIDKSSEKIKSDIKDKGKVIGNLFSKLFKTQAFKIKEDNKREIRLMIMLSKIDGVIEDEEKIFLSSEISHLDHFSVSEKMEFFNLMDAQVLPELNKKDVLFYSAEKFEETINKLNSLAGKDGKIEPKEEKFIQLVREKRIEFSTKK